MRLKGRIKEIILIESGINDPTAIFLTTVFVSLVDSGITEPSWAVASTGLPIFGLQVAGGLVGGLAGGFLFAGLINRITLHAGLYPPLVLAGGLLVFEVTQLTGGSGYLAVFIAGAIIRHRMQHTVERVINFHEGCSWLSQIIMFLMLGLLVTPHDLLANLGGALLLALCLMFVARPLAVTACLTPLGFGWREQVYIGWVGLRGAVPILLAIISVISAGPIDVRFFNIVFVIVIASLVLQGWTIPVTARWLRLTVD